jgi:ribosomal protein S18 acetylase RimI-like enzyme
MPITQHCPSNLSCREAGISDIVDILHLYAQPEIDNGEILSLAEARTLFERMATYPDYRLYVAFADDTIVGTFALLIMDNLGHQGRRSAIIEDVAVTPGMQGLGIGRFMMRRALKIAQEKDCYKVTLSSNLRRERAHAFYESLGFEKHGYSFRVQLDPLPSSVQPSPASSPPEPGKS